MLGRTVEIVRCPEVVDGAGLPRVQPQPWLSFATPMEQANGTRVQAPTLSFNVVPSKAMLVPSVVNGLDVPSQNQQKRWQRTQVIDPILLLNHHPIFNLLGVASLSPLVHIHHHHPGVEVAWLSSLEC